MLVEGAFAVLVLLAWKKVRGRKGMTEQRKEIYLAALEHLANPDALRELADGYEKDGLPIEASMLRKRAELRAMPREKWENFRALCENAIKKPNSNPQALEEMAQAFDAMTATGTAVKLRKRAAERRLEILAYAEEEQRKRIEDAEAKTKALQKDTEPPPTPNTTGVVEETAEANADPEQTLDPALIVEQVAQQEKADAVP